MKTYGVVVIGYGYWGPNLARNFEAHPRTRLVWVVDRDPAALGLVRGLAVSTTTRAADAITDLGVDLVAIATPTETHHALAAAALGAGKHVLVEKPMASNARDGKSLVCLARSTGRLLAVDHTFLFTGAVRRLREMVGGGELGDLRYVSGTRTNLGLYQPDCDVVWDLAPHDLAILAHLTGIREPMVVSATVSRHLDRAWADWAHVVLRYGETVADLAFSWLSPVKQRRMIFGGARRMAVWDDLENVEKLRVYDCGAKITTPAAARRARVEYRRGDMWAPKIDGTEALRAEVDNVVAAMDGEARLVSDGDLGLAVVRTLEAIDRKAVQA